MTFERRIIVVTGGAGYLGTAVCEGLLRKKAHVLCISSKKSPLNHSSLISVEADCADVNQIADCLQAYPGVDGLVNCVGRGSRGKGQHPDDFSAVLKNTLAVQYTCVCAIEPYLCLGSSIVNIGSMWGRRAPDFSLYLDLKNEPSPGVVAAFGGVRQLTQYLAVKLAPTTRVNSVVPGWFPKPSATPRQDYIDGITRRIPLGRIGKPEDIVGAILFLLSSASSYVTGQEIVVDGGYTIQ